MNHNRSFAFNIGVKFETPEEFFLQESPAKFVWGGVDPKTLAQSIFGDLLNLQVPSQEYNAKDIVSTKQELVICVGCPASGKSSFVKKYFVPSGYVRVNQVKIFFADLRTLSKQKTNV